MWLCKACLTTVGEVTLTSLPAAGLEPCAPPPPATRGTVNFDLRGNILWKCQRSDPGQVTVLQEERNSLLAENDVLRDRANQLDSFDGSGTPSGKKHSQLQIQLDTLQEENFRCVCVSVGLKLVPSGYACVFRFDVGLTVCVCVQAGGSEG